MTETNVIRPALFRAESLQARQLAWQGRPALALGLPTVFTTLASVALAASTAALITFGSYTRRVALEGAVLPNTGVIAISAPSPGRIERLAVKEGEAVRKDAVLYTLDVDTATKDGGVQQQAIETLKAQISETSAQIAMQQDLVIRLNKDYTTFADLARQHVVPIDELNPRQQAWMEAVTRLQDLESSQLQLRAKLADSEAHHSIEIRAPIDGVITAIVGRPGQTVNAGMPMLTIVPPHAPMQAELLAPSSAIGLINQGEGVRLRYSAFPYQKFGEYWGTVNTVSRAPLSEEDVKNLLAGMPPAKQNGPLYRIIAQPDSQRISINGEGKVLPAGMQVHAVVLLDRRSLYHWVLEPLYDVGRAIRGG